MKKNRIFKLFSLVIVLGITIFSVMITISNTEENRLIQVQKEALQLLEKEKGNYAEDKIVLQNTDKVRAELLADEIGADLRISANGEFATLTLPKGVSIEDVYRNDENRTFIEEMSLDYKVYLAEEEIDDETEILHGPNYQVEDPYYNMQTYLNYLNMQDVWNVTQGEYSNGEKVKVAVIDTGIDTDHPEFFDAYGNSIISTKSYDATNDRIVEMYDMSVIEDEDGHGTAVAGVIASQFNNEGIVGIAPNVELLVIKCDIDIYSGAFKYASDLVFGIYYAIEQDVDVINMSFGGSGNSSGAAIQLAVDSDIICVAGAGNDGTDAPFYPAADPNTIGVGALERDSWELADYSNYGPNSDIVAPGTAFTATIDGGYDFLNGTSIAAPIVSAVVALYVSQNKYVTFDTVKAEILASGKDLGDLGEDEYFGYGCIDVNAFIFEEKGTITWDYCTEDIENNEQVFVRQHTIQYVPVAERSKVIFDDWYYDKAYTRVFNYEDYYTTKFVEDITLYAKWANEDDEDSTAFSYIVLDDGTIEITKYNGKRRYLTIPDSLDGYIVSSIGKQSFNENTRLRTITMPSSLKYIKGDSLKGAFTGCTNLREVIFTGNNLLEIQDNAFYRCSSLKNIEILDSVYLIGESAFEKCSSLSKIFINETSNLATICSFAFSSTNITSFYIPKNSNFNASILYECENIREVIIHSDNVNYIEEDNAIFNNDKTTLLYYPSALNGDYVVNDTVLKIDNYAFSCSNITSCVMNDNVQHIGESAFNNSSIKTIRLSNNLVEISTGCFEKTDLEEIFIPKKVRYIDENSFYKCSYLVNVQFDEESELVSIRKNSFGLCKNLSNIILPNKLSIIGEEAFTDCYQLNTIIIPKSVNLLENKVFCNCYSLKKVIFEEGGSLSIISNACFFNCILLETVIFSDNITDIGSDTFYHCISLEILEFSENSKLKNVGKNAFYNNKSLESMQLPSTVEFIDDFAYTFSGLKSVNIPANLNHLGKAVFGGCYSLTEITVEDGNTCFNSIDNVLFNYDITELYCVPSSREGTYVLPETVKVVGQYAFYYDKFITNVILSDNLEDIRENAFNNCLLLEGIEIPAKVFNIGRQAFYECRSLKYVDFAENSVLERLGIYTFVYCTSLESIRIPSSISSMAQYVFYGCSNLTTVVFAENSKLPYISAYMFSGCSNLTEIIFESGSSLTSLQAHAFDGLSNLQVLDFGDAKLTNIDNYAFYNLIYLEEIIIPDTVTYIGRYAFYGCESLTRLDIPTNVEYIGENAFYTSNNNIRIFFKSEVLPEYAQYNWDNGIAGYFLNAKDYITTEVWEYVITYSNTIETVLYKGNDNVLELSEIDGLVVTKIGAKTFYNNLITNIILSDNVVEIGDYAFYGCNQLNELVIPMSVERIGNYVFAYSNINVVLSKNESLKEIGNYAFKHNKTENIELPDCVETIGGYAFADSELKTLSIGETSRLNSIGESAFVGSKLESIYLPSTLTNVGNNAFKDVTTLTNVMFAGGESNLKLGHSAFNNTGISEINIPANVNYIGEYTFGSNKNLININVDSNNKSYQSIDGMLLNITGNTLIQYPTGRSGHIVIPSYIEIITYAAIKDAVNITEVSFEEGSKIRTIGWEVFSGCSSLTKITVPDSVISFDYYSFKNCTALTDVVLSENSQLIGVYGGAFYNCYNLVNINLPLSVIDIGDYAFYNCKSLNEIPAKENSKLKGIGAYAFYGMENVTEIPYLPELLDIGSYAFADMVGITSIPYFPNLLNIGDCAFARTNITEYTVPASVVEISPKVFDECLKFENIYCEENNEEYESLNGILVDKNGSLTNVNDIVIYPYAHIYILGEGKEEIGYFDGEFIRYGLVKTIVWSETVTSIGDYAFDSCTNLTEIELPDNIVNIGKKAFANCTSLITITIPANVKTFDKYPFYNCFNLELVYFNVTSMYDNKNSTIFYNSGNKDNFKVVVGKNVTRIPEYLFYGSDITLVEYEEESVCEEIGESAFARCIELKNIHFPESIEFIRESAFRGCGLERVEILSNIKVIEKYAFSECNDVNSIYYDLENNYSEDYIFSKTGTKDSIIYIGENVLNIPSKIFAGANVYKVVFDDKTKCKEIGANAFNGCVELKEIEIPVTIETIGDYAIAGCDNLEKIYFNASSVTSGNSVFIGSGSTAEKMTLFVGTEVVNIPSNMFTRTNITHIEFEENGICEEIGSSAFYLCQLLTCVNLPNSIKKIGRSAFEECSNINSITISEKIINIEDYAFRGCSNLEEINYNAICADDFNEYSNIFTNSGIDGKGIVVNIGQQVKKIPAYFLYTRPNGYLNDLSPKVTSCNFSDGGTCSIGNYAFALCSDLIEVNLSTSVTSIGEKAFSGCSSLVSITISENVISIGAYAFENTYDLEHIEFNAISLLDLSYNTYAFDKAGIDTLGVNVKIGKNVTRIPSCLFYTIQGHNILNVTFDIESVCESIGNSAFERSGNLRSIILPNSLLTIENSAFSYCENLESITLPNNIEFIGDNAFLACERLSEIYFPESLVFIGTAAFAYTGLEEVVIPNNIKEINNSVFFQCLNLRSVVIPEGVESIGVGAFNNCKLKTITIPESVKIIGNNAFADCKYLEEIKFNASNMSDMDSGDYPNGMYVFRDSGVNGSGINVIIGANVTKIPTNLFGVSSEATTNIVSVEFEEGSVCESIGDKAFYNIESIKTLTLPESLKVIGKDAFNKLYYIEVIYFNSINMLDYTTTPFPKAGCNSEGMEVIIGNKVERIPSCLFAGDHINNEINVKNIIFEENSVLESIGARSFSYCKNLTEITLPSSVVSIEGEAFSNSGLVEVVISENVSEVGLFAFANCSIEKATLPILVLDSMSKENLKEVVITSGDTLRNSLFANCYTLESVILPSTLISIGNMAFYDCDNLVSITIPENVKSIGYMAFYECSNLEEINFNAISMDDAAEYILAPTNNLTVNVGSCVTRIPSYLFTGTNVTDVIFATKSVCETISVNAFRNCSNLKSINLPNTIKLIDSYAFYGCSSLLDINIQSINMINSYSFAYCSNLDNIILSKELDTIGDYAFAYCSSLEEIELPSTLKKINSNSFAYCIKLKEIHLGENISFIGDSAFTNCSNVHKINYNIPSLENFTSYSYIFNEVGSNTVGVEVIIGENVNYIPDYLFSNSQYIKTITINDECKVSSIGEGAFRDCIGLESIYLSANLETINQYAFANCPNLKDVYYNVRNLNDLEFTSYVFESSGTDMNIIIGNEVERIPAYLFYSLPVTNVIFEEESICTSIGDSSFSRTELRTVELPNSLMEIGSFAFYYCYYLEEINFNSINLFDLSNTVFYMAGNKSNGLKVNIGSSVKKIPNKIFSSSFVTEIVFSDNNNCITIGDSSFSGCKIKEISIPNNVTNISNSAFSGCPIETASIPSSAALAIKNESLVSVVITEGETIFENSFSGCINLEYITLPSSIKRIEASAFSNCSKLKEFTISDMIESIGRGAFSGCTKLEMINYNAINLQDLDIYDAVFSSTGTNGFIVNIGSNVIRIPAHLFNNNNSYSYVKKINFEVESNLLSIGDSAFTKSYLLEELKLPNTIEIIGENAFSKCENLKTITIPENVNYIGNAAFSYCYSVEVINFNASNMSGLEENNYVFSNTGTNGLIVNIGEKVVKIPDYLFYVYNGSSNVITVNFSLEGVCESIGDYAFYNASKLNSILLPDSVTNIGVCSFANCGLNDLDLPVNIIRIEDGAFTNCVNIKNIVLADNIEYLSESSFSGCNFENATVPAKFIEIVRNYNLKQIIITSGDCVESAAFSNYSKLESIILPETITSIGEKAFYNCSNLKSITISENVISIGKEAFYNCTNLEVINYNATNMNDLEVDNYIFAYVGKNTTGVTVNIGANVSRIPAYLFNVHHYYTDSLPYINSVNFEEGSVCESIGDSAFRNSLYLTNISLPESIQSIGNYSFYGCNKLTEISGMNNVTYIGNYAFYNCSLLSSVSLGNINTIGSYTFYNCSSLINITIPSSVKTIDSYAFSNCTNLESIELNEGLEVVKENAFYDCYKVKYLNVPSSVVTIERGAFYGWGSLEEIVVPFIGGELNNSNNSYFSYIFGSYGSSSSEYVPSTLKKVTVLGGQVGYNAFYGCSNIQTVILEDGVTSIGSYAFSDCMSLSEIVMSNNITSIGGVAFSNCTNLTNIIIPSSVNELGYSIFNGCSSLERVYIESEYSVVNIDNILNKYIKTIVIKEDLINDDSNILKKYSYKECLNNGYISYSKHEHNWLEKEVLVEKVNCVIDGLLLVECLECHLESEKIVSKHDNSDWITDYDSTCEVDGLKHIECINCGHILQEEIIPAFGHSYESPSYEWSADYTTNTATRVCLHDSSHIETEVVTTTRITLSNPSCESPGLVRYIANFNNYVFKQQRIEVDLLPLGHSYEITYSWNIYETYSLVSARATCKNNSNHVIDEISIADYVVVKEATCLENGIKKFIAMFENEIFTTQTKEVETYAIGHNLTYYSSLDPTCETAGHESYEECSRCDYSTYIEIPAIGHNYTDLSLYWDLLYNQVTATHVCSNNYNHIQTETVGISYSVITEPTCLGYGLGQYISEEFTILDIDIQTNVVDLSPLGHDLSYHGYLEPTCLENGHYAYEDCARCGYTTYEEIEALGHIEVVDVEVLPTCETTGLTEGSHCLRCNKVLIAQEVVDMLGHNYELNCNNDGTHTYICSNDNTHIILENCNLGDWIIITSPSEFEEGLEKQVCDDCGYEIARVIPSTHVHNYSNEWTIDINPTCLNDGLKSHHCTVNECGSVIDSTIIEALGHDLTYYEYQAPTCDSDGHHAYEECSRCDHNTYSKIDKLGHSYGYVSYTYNFNYTEITAQRICSHDSTHIETETVSITRNIITDPTCETEGLCEYIPNNFNNNAFSSSIFYRPIEALGHNLAYYDYLASTCESNGHYAYEECSRCDHSTYQEIVSTGHNYQQYIEAPTCLKGGYTTYICNNDQAHTYVSDYVDALGHDIISHDYLAPTCDSDGHYAYEECRRCDYTTYIVINALGHNYGEVKYNWSEDYNYVTATRICNNDSNHVETETVNINYEVIVSPTCLAIGLGRYISDEFVNEAFEVQMYEVVIAELGHDIISYDYLAPTCENPGHEAYVVCDRCNHSTYEEIEALGHIEVVDEAVLPTCETNGLTEGSHCLRCNNVLISQEIVDMLGHNYGEVSYEWSEDYNYVSATHICNNNSTHVETETVNTQVSVITLPTCEVAGLERYISNVFKNELFKVQTFDVVTNALGHNIKSYDYLAPTCETDGHEAYIACDRCSYSTIKTINSLGHDYVLVKEVKPTCDGEGYMTFECSRDSSHTYNKVLNPTGHNYNEEYLFDSTHHWQKCDCGSEGNKSAHTFSEWEIETEATTTLEGVMKRSCGCGYVETKAIDKVIKAGCSGSFNQSVLAIICLSSVIVYFSRKKRKEEQI